MKPTKYRSGILLLLFVLCMAFNGCLGTVVGTAGSVLFGANERESKQQEGLGRGEEITVLTSKVSTDQRS